MEHIMNATTNQSYMIILAPQTVPGLKDATAIYTAMNAKLQEKELDLNDSFHIVLLSVHL